MNTTTNGTLAPVLPLPGPATRTRVEDAALELGYIAQVAATAPVTQTTSIHDEVAAVLTGHAPAELVEIASSLVEQLRDQIITVRSYQAGAVADLAIPF